MFKFQDKLRWTLSHEPLLFIFHHISPLEGPKALSNEDLLHGISESRWCRHEWSPFPHWFASYQATTENIGAHIGWVSIFLSDEKMLYWTNEVSEILARDCPNNIFRNGVRHNDCQFMTCSDDYHLSPVSYNKLCNFWCRIHLIRLQWASRVLPLCHAFENAHKSLLMRSTICL